MTTALLLDSHQADVADLPADRTVFLEGPAGAGKTTAAVARLGRLLAAGIPGNAILIIVPQRALATPYTAVLRSADAPAGGEVNALTMGGLAQRMVELFWPLAAGAAGFAHPDRPPTFLTLETAQYYMARLVGPLLEGGYFDSIVIDRNRLYSQILDNLNKAAVVGFPYEEIGARLKAAWIGESSQTRVYDEAQECAARFRNYCLAHNLLDFSLQYETFVKHVSPLPACRDYLMGRYAHLFVDNVEEDTPVAHDILAEWLPHCCSALVIYDSGAGYRRFLGADPDSAYRLKALCREHFSFAGSRVLSPDAEALLRELSRALGRRSGSQTGRPLQEAAAAQGRAEEDSPDRVAATARAAGPGGDPRRALEYADQRYYPEMLDWVADRVAALVHEEGVPPREIAILAPFLSGGLRFSLAGRLESRGVAVRSHRPSRALREEPATTCLLTLAALYHPEWGIRPARPDVAQALMLAVDEMDPVRAHLLAEIAYREVDGVPALGSFSQIEPEMQERITFLLGGRYEGLRTWLMARRSAAEEGLDHFLSRLFGELLSQPGYGFHRNYDAGEITANLIESARKFRRVMIREMAAGGKSLAQEYVEMVRDGVVAAQYVQRWERQPEDAVLLAPAYTFLMSNRPVDHQFWLDVGSTGWWRRLYQPLTHPYVLSRGWAEGAAPQTAARGWTDADEYAARQEALACLVLGLVRRCRVQIHLGLNELGAGGNEERGPLLQVIQQVLRRCEAPRLAQGGGR